MALATVGVFLALAQGLSAETGPTGAPPAAHPQRLLVQVHPGATAVQVSATHARHGARVLRDLPQIGWQVVEVAPARRDTVREAYERESAFLRADLDRARGLAHQPNDPMWPGMWHMPAIGADDAWDDERGNASVRIAILDTGIEVTHPDLAANVWVNAGEIAGNGLDDDGNGYVDDVNGYDFAYGDSDPDDQHGHGTSCAGLAAAVQDNAIGVTGVAPYCQLVAVKTALDTGYFYDSFLVPAMVYCGDMGFQVMSMSFYSDLVTPAERAAIDYCWSKGCVPVAAAGNAATVLPYYPGSYEHVVAVAATDSNDNKAWFSNWGSWVDVAAPGLSLSTTSKNAGYTTSFAGTSGSAPHVAGLAALLFSAVPGATNAQVRAALEDTGVPLIQSPYGEYTNYGLVDADAAVDRILGRTTGFKPGRFLFASPAGGRPVTGPGQALGEPTLLVVYGVGLEVPVSVRVLRNGESLPLLIQARNQVVVSVAGAGRGVPGLDTFELEVHGNVVGTWVWEDKAGLAYVPSDAAGISGSVALGGFPELLRPDGQVLTITERGDGTVSAHMTIRKVFPRHIGRLTVEFTRAYDDSVGATEQVQLYDWSTGSYPYGNWVTVSTRTVRNTKVKTITADVWNQPDRFVDEEGTMYVQLVTSGTGASGLLKADCFRVLAR